MIVHYYDRDGIEHLEPFESMERNPKKGDCWINGRFVSKHQFDLLRKTMRETLGFGTGYAFIGGRCND